MRTSRKITAAQSRVIQDHYNGITSLRTAMNKLKLGRNYNRFYRMFYRWFTTDEFEGF